MSWVNKETLARKQREDTLVWKTSYLDVVSSHPEWLGGPLIEEAEYLREANETAWRWEFLVDVAGYPVHRVQLERVLAVDAAEPAPVVRAPLGYLQHRACHAAANRTQRIMR
jgi:hypothetical protein